MTDRKEVLVLPGDEPGKPLLGWTVREYQGAEVCLRTSIGVALTKADDLQPGIEVLVPCLTGGYHVMVVHKDKYGSLFAKDSEDKLMAVLKFCTNDRQAWVCVGLINMRGLEKLMAK